MTRSCWWLLVLALFATFAGCGDKQSQCTEVHISGDSAASPGDTVPFELTWDCLGGDIDDVSFRWSASGSCPVLVTPTTGLGVKVSIPADCSPSQVMLMAEAQRSKQPLRAEHALQISRSTPPATSPASANTAALPGPSSVPLVPGNLVPGSAFPATPYPAASEKDIVDVETLESRHRITIRAASPSTVLAGACWDLRQDIQLKEDQRIDVTFRSKQGTSLVCSFSSAQGDLFRVDAKARNTGSEGWKTASIRARELPETLRARLGKICVGLNPRGRLKPLSFEIGEIAVGKEETTRSASLGPIVIYKYKMTREGRVTPGPTCPWEASNVDCKPNKPQE